MKEQDREKIQIVIPTYNCVDCIDRTMKSIADQDYDGKKLYIVVVDFGSSDGTYEKLLTYSMTNLGVYQLPDSIIGTTMPAEANRLAGYTFPGGHNCQSVLLMPGDILYSNYISTCIDRMHEFKDEQPIAVICEVDVEREDGSIYSQKELYHHKQIIDGESQQIEYISSKIDHYVYRFGGGIATLKHRQSSAYNDWTWWSKSILMGQEQKIIYIPDRLACIQERYYEDELREILLRWESIILYIRSYESKYREKADGEIERLSARNLSFYAIWRSFLCYQRQNKVQAEACFKIAAIIDENITEEGIYRKIGDLVLHDKTDLQDEIQRFFEQI